LEVPRESRVDSCVPAGAVMLVVGRLASAADIFEFKEHLWATINNNYYKNSGKYLGCLFRGHCYWRSEAADWTAVGCCDVQVWNFGLACREYWG
jgi:hypothetical protein